MGNSFRFSVSSRVACSLRHPKPLIFLFCLNKLSYLPSQSWNLSSTQTTRNNQSIPQNVISTNYNRSQCPLRSSSTTTHRQSSPGIETAPPTYPATTATAGNEKHEYGTEHFQPQQQQQANPQQTFHQGTPHQSFQVGAAPANTGKYQMATPLGSLQQGPAPVDCPVCGVREMTRTEFVSGGTTHLSALLCCCCLCLGCIPYLASWFKDCEHKCGSCGALLAVWHRS